MLFYYLIFLKENRHLPQGGFSRSSLMNEKNETANVIYQIDCKGNDTEQCNKLYIGTTKSN